MKIPSLSLLKFLEDNGFGKIDQDLFWEKLGVDCDGVFISDLGGDNDLTSRPRFTYSLYCRGKNDLEAYKRLQAIANLLNSSYDVCTLPAVPPFTDEGVEGVTIMPVSAIVNAGQDINGRVI